MAVKIAGSIINWEAVKFYLRSLENLAGTDVVAG